MNDQHKNDKSDHNCKSSAQTACHKPGCIITKPIRPKHLETYRFRFMFIADQRHKGKGSNDWDKQKQPVSRTVSDNLKGAEHCIIQHKLPVKGQQRAEYGILVSCNAIFINVCRKTQQTGKDNTQIKTISTQNFPKIRFDIPQYHFPFPFHHFVGIMAYR